MADNEDGMLLSQEEFDMESEFFIDNYKTMIQWNEEEWDKDLENRNVYEFAVKSLRYWSGMLKAASDDCTALFAVFKNGKLITINEKIWIEFLKKANALPYFQNFYYVRNNYVLGIQFTDKKGKQLLIENFNLFRVGYIIDLDWYSALKTTLIRAHWLPKGFHTDELKDYMSKYIEIQQLTYEDSTKDNDTFPMNVVSFKGILKCDSVELIPHLTTFKGLQMLVVGSGRRPMCLRCECIGHKAAQCDKAYCKDCKILHMVNFKCEFKKKRIDLYADKLKKFKDSKVSAFDWPSLNRNNKVGEPPPLKPVDICLEQARSHEGSGNSKIIPYIESNKKLEDLSQIAEKVSQQATDIQDFIYNCSQADVKQGVAEEECPQDLVTGIIEQEDQSEKEMKMDYKTVSSKRKLELENKKEGNQSHGKKNTVDKVYVYGTKKSASYVTKTHNLFDALGSKSEPFSD